MNAQRSVSWLSYRLANLIASALLAVSSGLAGCSQPAEDDIATITGPLCVVHSPTLFGIDVSKWQGNIDWAKVKGAGVKYAFIRVSDGITTIDAQFPPNWAGAAANGIPRGVYQFFRPNRDAVDQAQIVIDHLDLYGMGELPPVVDVEATGELAPADVAKQVGLWIDEIESTLGVRPIIYSGSYFWDDHVNSSAFADYPFWIAHYTSAECPRLPQDWADWTFWQYSSTGSVNGIAGNVDMNRYAGTLDELLDLVPDEACRLDPEWRDCQDDVASTCVDGQIETTACGAASSCSASVCMADPPEVVESGPEPQPEVAEPQPEVVEPQPEVSEPDSAVFDTAVPAPDTTETTETTGTNDTTDTNAPTPDTQVGGAHAAIPSRSVSRRQLTPSDGCLGGGGSEQLGWLTLAALGVIARRRPMRAA